MKPLKEWYIQQKKIFRILKNENKKGESIKLGNLKVSHW